MASGRIKGITIEIGGDTKQLNSALKGVDGQLSTTKSALKDVEKLLKIDPKNVELLNQKQKLLNEAIEATKDRLDTLKGAMTEDLAPDEVDALNREIIATEQSLADFESQAANAADATGDLADESNDAADATDDANQGWSESKQVLADLAKEGLDKAAEACNKLTQALKGAVTDSAAYADDILTLSTEYGMSTDKLQEFSYMSQLVDTDLGTITGSMAKLTKSMSEMYKSGNASDAFKRLGVNVSDATGNMRSADEVFLDIIDRLNKMEPGIERDALTMEIFGKSAQELNPLIEQGSAGIAAYAQEAHDMGAVLDEETLQSLGEMQNGFDRIDQASTALKNTIGAALAPTITQISEAIANLAKWFQSLDPNVQQTILTVAGLVAGIITAIAAVSKIMAVVKGLGAVFSAISLGPAALIVGAIAAIIAIGVALYQHWDEIKEWASNLWDGIKETFSGIKDSISAAWDETKQKAEETWNNVTDWLSEKWSAIKEKASETWGNMKEAASNAWGAIKGKVEENGGGILGVLKTAGQNYIGVWKSAFTAIDNLTGGKLGEAWNQVKTILNNIKNAFTEKFNAIKNFVQGILDKIKGFFSGLKLELPKIKLPHIKLSGTLSLSPPSVPKLSIDWYKKAYDNPVMFTSPTVLPTSSGYKGFGDGAGAEIVIGLNKLQELVGNNGGGVTNNITIVQQPGQSAAQLADMVARRIQQNVERQKAVMG